jgi:hypothetical protein
VTKAQKTLNPYPTPSGGVTFLGVTLKGSFFRAWGSPLPTPFPQPQGGKGYALWALAPLGLP